MLPSFSLFVCLLSCRTTQLAWDLFVYRPLAMSSMSLCSLHLCEHCLYVLVLSNHSLYQCVHSINVFTVSMCSLYLCIHCIYLLSLSKYSMYLCIHCIYVFTVSICSLYLSIQCRYLCSNFYTSISLCPPLFLFISIPS